MTQKIVKLKDSTFVLNQTGFSSSDMCIDMKWDRSNITENDLCVYTDCHLNESKHPEKSIAWLIEPMVISPHIYELIVNIQDRFLKIFTHEKTLCDRGGPYELIPFGGCWIQHSDRYLHPKTKNVSIIVSHKNYAVGHRLRHEVVQKLKDKFDLYGNGYHAIDNKITALGDYRYSIIIENCKRDYYFTEKLIDCLLTGTIPIYFGCPSIGDFFDIRGFIVFDSVVELEAILDNLSDTDWNSRQEYIQSNFETAKTYVLAENHIAEKVRHLC
jgi:hypothetical protein